MKQKVYSDVKGSLWNHLDKKVILWRHEAPLFLRVYALHVVRNLSFACWHAIGLMIRYFIGHIGFTVACKMLLLYIIQVSATKVIGVEFTDGSI